MNSDSASKFAIDPLISYGYLKYVTNHDLFYILDIPNR